MSLTPGFSLSAPLRPVFQPGEGPGTIGEAYRPVEQDGSQKTYMDIIADQKRVEEVRGNFRILTIVFRRGNSNSKFSG